MIVTFSCSAEINGYDINGFGINGPSLAARTIFRDINHALNAMILSAAGTTPVAWENMRYEPVIGTSYIQVFHNPLRSGPASIGYNGFTTHRGIVQLNINTPGERGTKEAISLADQFTSVIRRGLVVTFNAIPVRILGLSIGAMDIQKAWAILPVTVNWHCYTPD